MTWISGKIAKNEIATYTIFCGSKMTHQKLLSNTDFTMLKPTSWLYTHIFGSPLQGAKYSHFVTVFYENV